LLHIALRLFAYNFKLQACIIHLFYKLSGSTTETLQVFCAVSYIETIVFSLPFELCIYVYNCRCIEQRVLQM